MKRPKILTFLIPLIFLVNGFVLLVMIFNEESVFNSVSPLNKLFLMTVVTSVAISYVGVWFMMKWGVWLYFITLVVFTLYRIPMDNLRIIDITLELILLFIFITHYSKMSPNKNQIDSS